MHTDVPPLELLDALVDELLAVLEALVDELLVLEALVELLLEALVDELLVLEALVELLLEALVDELPLEEVVPLPPPDEELVDDSEEELVSGSKVGVAEHPACATASALAIPASALDPRATRRNLMEEGEQLPHHAARSTSTACSGRLALPQAEPPSSVAPMPSAIVHAQRRSKRARACWLSAVALAAGAFALVGCAPSLPPGAPAQADGTQAARCSVRASLERPFVTEWPATERSRLESKMASGLVAVSYSGCEMQVLDRCRAEGSYRFVRTSVATDGFSVTSDDELYAKLPLGAASLEGELKRAGKLSLSYAVVGQYEAAEPDPARVKLVGDCSRATHLVTGYAVGAFSLASGSADSVGGGVSVPAVGVGVKRSQSQDVIRSSGGLDACKDEPAGANARTEPPQGCRTPIQLFLAALPGSGGAAGASARVEGASGGAAGASGRVEGASGGRVAATGDARAEAIPDLRGLAYLGGGAAGGAGLLLGGTRYSLSVGPMAIGALGLRYRFSDDLEFLLRGTLALAWHAATSGAIDDKLMLVQPGLEASLRFRPKSWRFYLGVGPDGSLTIITGATGNAPPRVLVHGFLETGMLLGAAEEWDLGVHGGVGSSIVFDNPALFQTTLLLGRAFH